MEYEREFLFSGRDEGNDNDDHMQSHSSWGGSGTIVGMKRPRRFWIGILITFFLNVGLSMVNITMYPYIVLNNESIYIYALCLSSYQIGIAAGRNIYSMLHKFTGFTSSLTTTWILLAITISIQLVGDLLYAIAPAQVALTSSRFVVGIANAISFLIIQRLLTRARNHDAELQKSRLKSLNLMILVALPIAAILVALISKLVINRQMNFFSLDHSTVAFYGWMTVIFTSLALILSIIGGIIDKSSHQFEDDHNQFMDEYFNSIPRSNINYRTQESCILPPKATMVLFCIVHFLICNCGLLIDGVFIPSLVGIYDWDVTKISMFYIGIGLTLTATSLLSRRITSNSFLFYASILFMAVGYFIMTTWSMDKPSSIFRYVLGSIFVFIGSPISMISSSTIFYDFKSSINYKSISTLFYLSNSFGKLLPSIISIVLYEKSSINSPYVFGMMIGLASIGIFLTLGKSFKHINTVSRIHKHVPILSEADENRINI